LGLADKKLTHENGFLINT